MTDKLTVYADNNVALNGRFVGRVDRDSYRMLSGVRGKTTFFTGTPGTYDEPHEMPMPLYVPKVEGSVSDWKVNPEFTAAVRAVMDASA